LWQLAAEAKFAQNRTKISVKKGGIVDLIHEIDVGKENEWQKGSKMIWKVGYDGKKKGYRTGFAMNF